MKKLFFILIASSVIPSLSAQKLQVSIEDSSQGKILVSPKIPKSGTLKKGTEITLKVVPQEGMSLDALYYTYKGMWGTMYSESMEDTYTFTLNEETQLGASFVASSEVDHLNVTQNVVYAKPGNKPLKYDVFSPKGAQNLPAIIIIHGGGWSANNEDIMRGLARTLTKNGNFVVFSIDYRWIRDLDGDQPETQMYQIIEDVFGGIAHIQEHASEYGADGSKLFLTGDSAGGHLSASASVMIENIGLGGFSKEKGIFQYKPSYIPANKSIDELRVSLQKSILGAAPSYGVFRTKSLERFVEKDTLVGNQIAPINHIPSIENRSIPNFLVRGTKDPLITDEEVAAYTKALVDAGQRAEYIQVGGAGHAFFDWKPDQRTKDTYKEYGLYYAQRMEAFFLSILK